MAENCGHGHSMADAYSYEAVGRNGNIYIKTICKKCTSIRNIKYKARKRKNKPPKSDFTPTIVSSLTLLSCGHEVLFRPMPKLGDWLFCMRCDEYQVRVKRTANAKRREDNSSGETEISASG